MPHSKKSPAAGSTRHLSSSRKTVDRGGSVTRERIEEDLRAFVKAGGRIEVLGTTRTLTRIDPAIGPVPTPVRSGSKPRD